MSLSVNNNFGLGDQLPYGDNAQIKSLSKMLPENATSADFFNIYSQEVKSIQLKSLFDENNDGAGIGDETSQDSSILGSSSSDEFTSLLRVKTIVSDFIQPQTQIQTTTDFLDSIKLMEDVQSNAALIGKNVSYVESSNGQAKKSKVEKVVIDNMVPYIVISDGRHLRINEVKEIDNEE